MKLFCMAWLMGIAATIPLHAQKLSPILPLPNAKQVARVDMDFYLFVHFGPNTFTDMEWGAGTEKEEIFNPQKMDCRQWCRIAKAAGAKGIIITAKHHDGFCLWPSKFSTHTVLQSTWRNGQGDVLRELQIACKETGLKMGVYLSPWDRNHPQYGTPAYNDVFVHMMEEVTQQYGPFFEFWWDGANGEGPNGKLQVYDWNRFKQTIQTIAPNTCVFSDIGPDLRWVGNENGIAGTTNWSMLDTVGYKPGLGAPTNDVLNQGLENGACWIPAECDVSIRPGWFYHDKEDALVKTPEQLFNLYLKSVGRNASLLLNVPPNRDGLFTAYDSAALMGFKQLRDNSFNNSLLSDATILLNHKKNNQVKLKLTDKNVATYMALPAKHTAAPITLQFKKAMPINCIQLQEPIAMGQRIKAFTIQLIAEDNQITILKGSTIGLKRILSFKTQKIKTMVLVIDDCRAQPLLSEMALFAIPEYLVEQ